MHIFHPWKYLDEYINIEMYTESGNHVYDQKAQLRRCPKCGRTSVKKVRMAGFWPF